MRTRRTIRLWELLVGVAVIAAGIAAVSLIPSLRDALWLNPDRDAAAPAPSTGSDVAVPRPDDAFALTVQYVYDGDTIRAVVDEPNALVPSRDPVRIRLIGIDTPEGTPTVECGAEEARDHLRALLPEGSRVWAATDRDPRDRYDRALLYLWTDGGTFVNHELVAAGDAEAIRVGRNDAHFALLSAAEQRAREAGLGQWGSC